MKAKGSNSKTPGAQVMHEDNTGPGTGEESNKKTV